MRERIVVAAALLSISAPAHPFWEKLDLDADAAIARDSNVANGVGDGKRIAETSVTAALAASRTHVFARSALTYGVRIEGTRFGELRDLDHHALSGFAQAAFQPVVGYGEPWFEAGLQASAFRHRNSDARDGTQWNARLGIAKRLTDRIKATFALEGERRTSHVSGFDTAQHRFRLALDYKMTERSMWSINVARGHGDYVLTQTDPCTVQSPCMRDPALRSGSGRAFFAFKAPGSRKEVGLNYRFRVSPTVSLDVILSHAALHSRSDGDARRRGAFIAVSKHF